MNSIYVFTSFMNLKFCLFFILLVLLLLPSTSCLVWEYFTYRWPTSSSSLDLWSVLDEIKQVNTLPGNLQVKSSIQHDLANILSDTDVSLSPEHKRFPCLSFKICTTVVSHLVQASLLKTSELSFFIFFQYVFYTDLWCCYYNCI